MGALALAVGGCATGPSQIDTSKLVWPPPPDDPRIRFVAQYGSQSDLGKDLKSRLLGDGGASPELQKPYGVAATRDAKKIYVTDTRLRALMVFDLKARRLHRFRTDAMGGLVSPIEVRVDSRGRVYVTDSVHAKLNVYSPQGKTLMSLGRKEVLARPTGLALDEKRGRIYVSDTKNHRIVVYDMDGAYVDDFGVRGTAPGEFNYPVNLTVDGAGNLYVVDTGNFRVQIFGPDRRFKGTFGRAGDSMGAVARPKGIALDSDGHVYLVDAAFNNFQVFDKEGKILLFVGSAGLDPGKFWLPAGIFIDGSDRIYVVDSANARIQVFQYLGESASTEEHTSG